MRIVFSWIILMNYSCLDFHVGSKPRLKPRGNTDGTSRVRFVANPFLFNLWFRTLLHLVQMLAKLARSSGFMSLHIHRGISTRGSSLNITVDSPLWSTVRGGSRKRKGGCWSIEHEARVVTSAEARKEKSWGHAYFQCSKTRENPILSQGKSHFRLIELLQIVN